MDTFVQVGSVNSAEIIKDRFGRSRGFATVLFNTKDDAQKAITDLNNTNFKGRQVTVTLDKFA
jgi:RNA recognition motif-containing protein